MSMFARDGGSTWSLASANKSIVQSRPDGPLSVSLALAIMIHRVRSTSDSGALASSWSCEGPDAYRLRLTLLESRRPSVCVSIEGASLGAWCVPGVPPPAPTPTHEPRGRCRDVLEV